MSFRPRPYEFDRKRALKFGADGFILKPINPKTFLGELEKIAEDKIEMTFWGVRGTLPVPGEGSLKYGGNTSCVTLEFAKGQFFIFDAGTGIKVLSDQLLRQSKSQMEVVSDSWWKLVFGVAPDHDGCSIRRRGQSAS